MKKVISIKETTIILISVLIVTALAVTSVSAVSFDDPTIISGNEYNGAQTIPDDNNTTNNTVNNVSNNTVNNVANNTVNNATNNKVNNTKVYNTNNTTDLPQTGIEDYNIGILLIICIASAIFAYKKVNDYRSL